jgi:hypothetical protein
MARNAAQDQRKELQRRDTEVDQARGVIENKHSTDV